MAKHRRGLARRGACSLLVGISHGLSVSFLDDGVVVNRSSGVKVFLTSLLKRVWISGMLGAVTIWLSKLKVLYRDFCPLLNRRKGMKVVITERYNFKYSLIFDKKASSTKLDALLYRTSSYIPYAASLSWGCHRGYIHTLRLLMAR